MFERLATFVQERRRLVAIGAGVFFLAAGALGSSVADRLDPYGADDPDTETVIATERLEDAGYRSTGRGRPRRGPRHAQPPPAGSASTRWRPRSRATRTSPR